MMTIDDIFNRVKWELVTDDKVRQVIKKAITKAYNSGSQVKSLEIGGVEYIRQDKSDDKEIDYEQSRINKLTEECLQGREKVLYRELDEYLLANYGSVGHTKITNAITRLGYKRTLSYSPEVKNVERFVIHKDYIPLQTRKRLKKMTIFKNGE
jgi:hypothetical protein